MNSIHDPLEMPKVIKDQIDLAEEEADNTRMSQWGKGHTMETKNDKWADRLWPSMAWFIFVFNAFVSLTFCFRILTDSVDSLHSAAMYVTIVITMCGTYMALMWAHYNILRKK